MSEQCLGGEHHPAMSQYGEVFDRNSAPRTPLGIPRGLNQLWTSGGIQYAPPIR